MDEKLLLKCDNTVYADEITSLLYEHGIASRQHDERQDTAVGAYGAVTGVAVFVFKKDYDKALELVAPVIQERKNARPICPNCASVNVEPLARPRKYVSLIRGVLLLMILLPIITLPILLGLHSEIIKIVIFVVFCASWVLLFLMRHASDNYKCGECGRTFHHLESK